MPVKGQTDLRKPFEPQQIGKLPRGGIQLDYVGHAAVTDRLLEVDPAWSWEPMGVDEFGAPKVYETTDNFNKPLKGMWIKLTVLGVTRPGFGDGKTEKECIGDAIRNAAMRFGVALDLWSKEELHPAPETIDPPAPEEPSVSINDVFEKSSHPLTKDQVTELMKLAKGKGAKTIAEAKNFINKIAQTEDFTLMDTDEFMRLRSLILNNRFAEVANDGLQA